MLKILQARLQQYMNQELPDVQVGFRKGRGTRDQIANICWIIKKGKRVRETSTSSFLTTPKHLTMWIIGSRLWHISLKSFCIPFLDPISPAVPQPLFREAIPYFVFTIFLLFFILYYISMYLEATNNLILLLLFSCSVVSNSLRPHRLQHTRLPCPSVAPRVCSNSCPLNQ